MQHSTSCSFKLEVQFGGENSLILVEAAFAMIILDLIFRVRLASFMIGLPKQLKYSTFSCPYNT
jgi:hypothetical protein